MKKKFIFIYRYNASHIGNEEAAMIALWEPCVVRGAHVWSVNLEVLKSFNFNFF